MISRTIHGGKKIMAKSQKRFAAILGIIVLAAKRINEKKDITLASRT